LVLAAVACEPQYGAGPGPTNEFCRIAYTEFSCNAGAARAHSVWGWGGSPETACDLPPETSTATCASGCAIEGVVRIHGGTFPTPWGWWRADASVLCAEAPARAVDEACVWETDACVPTRSVMNDDGTVRGHTYLDCEPSTGRCAPVNPPVIERYMERCDAAIEAQHGGAGISAAVVTDAARSIACLLTWDDATQSVRSGITRWCLADWQCPLYSLCDADIRDPGGFAGPPVCKRGPRGMLTPALLVP
jgi:hypothetical protein